MGFYFRVAPGVKIRATKRGLRTSVGPRAARVHFGAGGTGVSTGAGPVSYYAPLGGGKSRTRGSTSRATRSLAAAQRGRPAGPTPAQQLKAAQAVAIAGALDAILGLHRVDFPAAAPPVAPAAPAPSYQEVLARHTKAATANIALFQRRRRAEATAQATAAAQAEYAAIEQGAQQQRTQLQRQLDEWWRQLLANEPAHVSWVVEKAFEDNEAAAAPTGVLGATLSLVVQVPGTDVVPDRMPGTTAAGNVSLRKATKGQRGGLYRHVVCGYLLVTIREAFAVAPGIDEVAIVAVRQAPPDAYGVRRAEAIAAVRVTRQALVGIQWRTADAVQIIDDAAAERIFETRGAAAELVPLDVREHPDLQAALDAVELGPGSLEAR